VAVGYNEAFAGAGMSDSTFQKVRGSRPYILVGRVLKVGMVLGCSYDNRNDIDIIDRVL